MKITPEGDTACAWDVDDTLVDRGRIPRALGVVKAQVSSKHLPSYDLDHLPVLTEEVVEEPLRGMAEQMSFLAHQTRTVIPYARVLLRTSLENGNDNYGNTGRPNKRAWVEMTRRTFERGGIDGFIKSTFHTPEGMRTAVSKAAALKELLQHYTHVEHWEDDPRTAVYLAQLFPGVRIHLVQYGSSGLLYSRAQVAAYRNIDPVFYPRMS